MNITNNTILITGGSAGIGFEIAKLLSAKGNKVIITGRDEDRLLKAASHLSNVTAIVSDVTKEADLNLLLKQIEQNFPGLNILVNNAGHAFAYQLSAQANAKQKATEEILTNYLSVIGITEKFLPLLQKQPEAAIVNVSSIVALVASHRTPTYAASKAALHSYTQSLRISLENSSIKVFELMPPLVNTEFSKEIGGHNGIAPGVVAENLINALENNEFEIRVGRTEDLYQLYLHSPAEALLAMNANR